jgi:hypothetical protein
MNMLMVAPLLDSRGNCRYFIGAQVDVSGLCKDCTDLQGLQRLLEKEDRKANPHNYPEEEEEEEEEEESHKDEFQALAEVLSGPELDIIRRHGGKMHSQHVDDPADIQRHDRDRPRLLLKDQTPTPPDAFRSAFIPDKANGKLEGIYQNVSIVAALQHPSLTIASISLYDLTPLSEFSSPHPHFASQEYYSPRSSTELVAPPVSATNSQLPLPKAAA